MRLDDQMQHVTPVRSAVIARASALATNNGSEARLDDGSRFNELDIKPSPNK